MTHVYCNDMKQLWFTNSEKWTVNEGWILWTGTVVGCGRETDHTVGLFSCENWSERRGDVTSHNSKFYHVNSGSSIG
jgi:hypothetical protein